MKRSASISYRAQKDVFVCFYDAVNDGFYWEMNGDEIDIETVLRLIGNDRVLEMEGSLLPE